jgi:hypothetical protein
MHHAAVCPAIEILETRIAPSTVDVVGGVLIFTAGAGESNTIDFRIQSGSYRISDGADPTITQAAALAGFVSGGPGSGVVTGPTTVIGVTFNLGDMNDVLNVQGLADPLTVDGGAGDDSFTTNSFSGAITLNAGGGAVYVETESVSLSAFSGTPFTNASTVTFKTDNFQIGANGGITASQSVTFLPLTAGRGINLGTENAAQLSLTTSEIGKLATPTIIFGDAATGSIDITASLNFGNDDVALISGSNITESGGGVSITAGGLAVNAGVSAVFNGPNNVNKLAAKAGGANNFAFTDSTGFQIDTVLGLTGLFAGNISWSAGPVTQAEGAKILASSLTLQGAGPFTLTEPTNDTSNLETINTGELIYTDANGITIGSGFGITTANNADVTLAAKTVNIMGAINVGTGSVTIKPLSTSTGIDLGGADSGSTLGLTTTELNLITADSVQLGAVGSTGAVTVSAAIAPAHFTALRLDGTGVSGAGSITVAKLAVVSSGNLSLTGANDVDFLSFTSSGGGGTNAFSDVDGFSLGDPALYNNFEQVGPNITTLDVGTGTVAFPSGTNVSLRINGTTAGTGYSQIAVKGTVDLGSATLTLNPGNAVPFGTEFILIDNDGTADDVTGTFDGLDEGDIIPGFSPQARITYHGGDGNDVAIKTIDPLGSTPSTNGKSITFTDVDGDLVTITASKGTFTGNEVFGVETGPNNAGRFEKLKLGAGFAGANITITAKPSVNGGNGFVNLGWLDATGVDLGTVTIAGDVTRITAGSASGDPKVAAIKSLTVQSVAMLGNATLPTAEQLGFLGLDLKGSLPKLTIKDDLRASVVVDHNGKLGTATIGGSIVGFGDIFADGGIGSLKVVGDIRAIGGTVQIITYGAIGSVTVDGSIYGFDINNLVEIDAFGQETAPTKGSDVAIKSIIVKGSVQLLSINAGNLGSLNADASIGSITVGGDWIASSVTAGTEAGLDTVIGTNDDALVTGGRDNADIHSSIGSFTVKGQALGTYGSTTDMFGVVAEQIGKAKVGGRTFAFKADKTGTPNREAFFAAPTLDGAGTENPMFDFTIREVGSTTPAGTVAGGVNLQISANGKTATYNDVDGDIVTVKRTLGTFAADKSEFDMTTTASGGGILHELTLASTPGNLTITAKPGPDGGNGFANVLELDLAGLPIGNVSVAGNLDSFDGGMSVGGKPGVASLSAHSMGLLGSGYTTQFSGGLGKLTVAADVRNESFNVVGKLGSATLGGSFLNSSIFAENGLGAVKIAGSMRGATIGAGIGALDSLTIGGDFIGDSGNTTIAAFGQLTAPAKGLDLAIKSLTVKGGIEGVRITAGTRDLGVNADASIGAIKVGRHWLGSSISAGADAAADGFLGTADDAKYAGPGVRDNTTTIFSSIASITIKGQAFGSAIAGDHFGIVAEQIGSAQIGTVKFKFTKGPRNATDAFAIAPTFPGAGNPQLPFDFYIREITDTIV